VRDFLIGAGVADPKVEAEASQKTAANVDDWCTIVIGSGFTWTVEQMGSERAKQVREDNLNGPHARAATCIETNVIYALARKASAQCSCGRPQAEARTNAGYHEATLAVASFVRPADSLWVRRA
jgi:hypothetical protein